MKEHATSGVLVVFTLCLLCSGVMTGQIVATI